MESVEYLGFLIEVVSPKTGTYEYSVFDMTGKDKPEFPVFETDDVEFISFGAALDDAKSWVRDFLFLDDDRAVEHIEKLYATKKALSGFPSVNTTGSLLQKLTTDVFNRSDCPKWAKYAAVDECGCVRLFSDSPWLGESCWNWSKGEVRQLFGVKFDASNWQKSRIRRPDKNTLPDWCKVGEWVYYFDEVDGHSYQKIDKIDDKYIYFYRKFDRSKPSDPLVSDRVVYSVFIENSIQARLRPYNAEEMKALVGKIITSSDGAVRLCTAWLAQNNTVLIDNMRWQSEDLIRVGYTINGEPCGKLVHKEGDEWVE